MATSIIDQMIGRYGGADEAYKLKLRTNIRNMFGYSNYMSKFGQETASPASIGDVSGLSPAGVNARIQSRFGTQDQNINALQGAAGAIDTAAGSIADRLAAKSRAAMKNEF